MTNADASVAPGYATATRCYRIGEHDYRLRELTDRQQFHDPDGVAERAGVSSAQWSLFGVVWPAALALASAMDTYPIAGKRVLELGCGLALASLVLARRGANITATDCHPLAAAFLRHNAALNGFAPVRYRNAPWGGRDSGLGRFDLIIASDVLYEPGQAESLAEFIAAHAASAVQIMIADPGRAHHGRLSALLRRAGYAHVAHRVRFVDDDRPTARGRLLCYARGTDAALLLPPLT